LVLLSSFELQHAPVKFATACDQVCSSEAQQHVVKHLELAFASREKHFRCFILNTLHDIACNIFGNKARVWRHADLHLYKIV